MLLVDETDQTGSSLSSGRVSESLQIKRLFLWFDERIVGFKHRPDHLRHPSSPTSTRACVYEIIVNWTLFFFFLFVFELSVVCFSACSAKYDVFCLLPQFVSACFTAAGPMNAKCHMCVRACVCACVCGRVRASRHLLKAPEAKHLDCLKP